MRTPRNLEGLKRVTLSHAKIAEEERKARGPFKAEPESIEEVNGARKAFVELAEANGRGFSTYEIIDLGLTDIVPTITHGDIVRELNQNTPQNSSPDFQTKGLYAIGRWSHNTKHF